jgi:hypothetical protein
MGRLKKQAQRSPIMDFDITYAGKHIRFNLYEELNIDTQDLNTDLMTQPRLYSFLTMLRQAYIKKVKDVEKQKEEALAKAIEKQLTSDKTIYFKRRGSYVPANMAKEIAKKDPEYIDLCEKFVEYEDVKNRLNNAVEAFEQRGYLLQTLSANLRKERV